jgi:hypothetical protein
MNDEMFTKLGLEVSICPTQHCWPNPTVEFRTEGDSICARGLHWSRNHEAADWLRDYTARALADLAAVDADETLSPVGKANKKKPLAAKAKAAIEKSKELAQAKEISGRMLAKWEKEFESDLKQATTTHTATVYAKLWDRCHELQGAERLAWLKSHAADPTFASALLTAPTAVTGLKSDELTFLREQFEKVVHPEAAEDRPPTLQVIDDLDRGARNATNRICQAAGVKPDELSDPKVPEPAVV